MEKLGKRLRAEFVALLTDGRLRGCLGRLSVVGDTVFADAFVDTAPTGGDEKQDEVLERKLAIPGKVRSRLAGMIRGCHCANGTHQEIVRALCVVHKISLLVISGVR